MELTHDLKNKDLNQESPTIGKETQIYPTFGTSLGIHKRLDVSLLYPFGANAKFQILGSSAEDAEAGNISISIVGSGIWIPSKDSFEGTEYSLNTYCYDAHLIGGYRVSDRFLFYGGPFAGRVVYTGTYSSPVLAISSKDFSGKVNQFGINSGVEWRWPWWGGSLRGDIAAVTIIPGAVAYTVLTGGIQFQYSWFDF